MTDPQSDCFKHGCHARFDVALITCQRDAACYANARKPSLEVAPTTLVTFS